MHKQESKIQRTISNIREDIDIKWEKIKVFTNYCLKIARNRMKKAIIEWYNAFKMYKIAINIIEIRQNVSLL